MKRIDMTNWQMKDHGVPDSRWVVLESVGKSKWKCQCSCEKQTIRIINGADLRSGHSKSCGCYKSDKSAKHSKDITNQKFGMLTALYPTNKRQLTNIIWHCKCDCGNECDVSLMYLTNGHTSSCGCLSTSKGVAQIITLLEKYNIPFEREKTFLDCKDKNVLPFDFFVNNQYLIEYDGAQHFKPGATDSKWHELEYYQKHDKIKNQWAKEHNIPLIRIPFYVKQINLEDIKLETTTMKME